MNHNPYHHPDLPFVPIVFDKELYDFSMQEVEQINAYYAEGEHGTTFYNPKANEIGALGQNAVNQYLLERGYPITTCPFFVPGQKGDGGDFIFHTRNHGDLINDIKSTFTKDEPHGGFWVRVKQSTERPDGSVIDFRQKKIHHYTFVAVDPMQMKAYIMGVIPHKEFWDDNLPHETITTTMDNGTIVTQRRIRARHLKNLFDYLNYYK